MAIGCIGQWTRRIRIKQAQHRTLSIRREQTDFYGAALALLLREQLIIVLHDRTLHRTLNLGGQPIVEIVTLGARLLRRCNSSQPIDWIVSVMAEQHFTLGLHGPGSLKSPRFHCEGIGQGWLLSELIGPPDSRGVEFLSEHRQRPLIQHRPSRQAAVPFIARHPVFHVLST
ncbi:hypothetical protein PS676_05939 [Pseudomonas fluorescens]|nr:hypothetical protein PS676_05939 [Pseudomonas fluorescens]